MVTRGFQTKKGLGKTTFELWGNKKEEKEGEIAGRRDRGYIAEALVRWLRERIGIGESHAGRGRSRAGHGVSAVGWECRE